MYSVNNVKEIPDSKTHINSATSLTDSLNGFVTDENNSNGCVANSAFNTKTTAIAIINSAEQTANKTAHPHKETENNLESSVAATSCESNKSAGAIKPTTITNICHTHNNNTTPHCSESLATLSATTPSEAAATAIATTAEASATATPTPTPISDFYQNATVLITGGTGFVGKVLTQKLLRAFELRRIYMLIRCKDNMCVEERLENFFKESIFDTIRTEQPELFRKVHAVRVDYSAIDLGIAAEDREILCDEVEIIFNVVASVKFNEKLSDAIDINVLGTKKILDLSMEMKKLKSLVHISTLYCNCNRKYIKERVYENDIGYEKIMQIFRIFDDETLEKFRHCLIGDMPNTYTMTKKCAENLVNHRAFYMPAGIFRPPIVMSTYKDPFPGWTDNLYGPSGLCTWSARGLVRCIYGRANCKANMVPADYCVNAMIASAWDIARRFLLRKSDTQSKEELPVYNYIFDRNNLTWGQYMRMSREGFHEPFDKALWCFSYVIIPSKPLHYAVAFFLHNIPAYILDFIALVTGRKRIYIKAYRKISRVIYMMSWFGLKDWRFAHNNIDELDAMLCKTQERNLLQFNMATINWREYFRSYLSGIRRYFFKDNDNKLQKRRAFYRRLQILHQLLKTTFGLALIACLLKMYFKIFKIIPKIAF
ncbi:fatty acyl-CoA reductase wat isoform X1 [Bactrocera neohumeralis]|uniref:fatty acyl-CoA reductase wat isoform X1 n=1 Tax=Bactrocera neohumeralis TaxID=98809 RepID=UPI0021665259|nr:fatty acyl-CoA reductase wat isoform X1 [Bactrocera neohumeralis]